MAFIVVDTEGVQVPTRGVNENDLGKLSQFYDFGFIVAENDGTILERYSFVNSDVFFNKPLMNGAYYAEKLPQYHAGIGDEWLPLSTLSIWETFCKAIKTYNVKKVWAYNARYDRDSCNRTIKDFSNGFRKFFMPYGVKWGDIWDYAGATICNTQKYIKWCFDNGFKTKSGNPMTNADTVGKYITQNMDFVEQHTALSDCEIELEILLACKKRHAAQPKTMGQGWRKPAKLAKEISKKDVDK